MRQRNVSEEINTLTQLVKDDLSLVQFKRKFSM